jgi:hypothetical protein
MRVTERVRLWIEIRVLDSTLQNQIHGIFEFLCTAIMKVRSELNI